MFTSSAIVSFLALAAGVSAKGIYATPHDKYSSSIGVLGCKINTNRVAYWPETVTKDNLCVKLTNGDRSVKLLRIDQSQGAHDISYDAWVYLQSGDSATSNAMDGGPVAMDFEQLDAEECLSDNDLILTKDGKLPLSATNSMNFVTSCGDWASKNIALYNICDAICTVGYDEPCEMPDLAAGFNQPTCKHTLGLTTKLTTSPVYDIQYSTGLKVLAGSPDSAPVYAPDSGKGSDSKPSTTAAAAPTTSQAPTVQAVPAPSSADEGGKFKEVSSSSAAAVETTQAAAPTTSSAAAAQTTAPSPTLNAPSSPAAPTVVSSPVLSSSSPAAVVTPTSAGFIAPSSSTFSVVTLSTNQTTSAVGSTAPTASATRAPTSAGLRGSQVSLVALVSSFVISSVVMSLF